MPAGAFNTYSDRAEYDAAMAEWQRKKAAGDPFPGPMPRMDEAMSINARADSVNFPREIRNASAWQQMAQQGANAPARANPYSTVVADQSRAAQLALIQQMRGQMSGPSLAAMQGQRALAQSGQQALGAAAMGAPGRAAMLQAQGVGAGLAGDVGQARLAEVMRAQAGMGGAAGNLRGADLRSAEAQMQSGLAARRQSDALRQFYASQGSSLAEAQARAALEMTKLRERMKQTNRENTMSAADSSAGLLGGIFGGMM